MSEDLKIMASLEESLQIQLKQIPAELILSESVVGYAVDDENHVVALALDDLKLSQLPALVLKLKNLRILSLVDNQIPTLPAEIAQLQALQTLDLDSNRLSALPDEITQLSELQTLDLGDNAFLSFPPQLPRIRGLRTLDLSRNQLLSVPAEISRLQKLQTLDLSDNQLAGLPDTIIQLNLNFSLTQYESRVGYMSLHGNPIETPPLEILRQGRDAVVAYFDSLGGDERPLNEVKILLVGDGAVGKTSLVKRLVGERFNPHESQTHGINLRRWQMPERSVVGHFWDFGGQEIMHATHQFFLSKRSIYILVLDGRKDEKTEYWLKTIESFGGDSPVLVVLNKIDENPGFDVNGPHLQKKYPGILGFHRVSCLKNEGIDHLRSALHEALDRVQILGTLWGTSWFEVKSDLEQMKKRNKSFISLDKYTDLCESKGVKDRAGQNTLVGFLNDLGVIVHFQDFDLKDVYVLEPRWVTTGVYKIINSKQLAEAKGILDLRKLTDILKPRRLYPSSKHRFIVGLMKKFELCYEIDETTVLVPDLLNVREPPFELEDESLLSFRFDYREYLPRSIMPRFVVKLHTDIHENLCWRTGVVLKSRSFQATAVVKCDYESNQIDIQVAGLQKQNYFAAILFFLREIHRNFEKLDVHEAVPLPDNPRVSVPYQSLLFHERQGYTKISSPDGTREYLVSELLGSVRYDGSTERQQLELLQAILEKVTQDKEVTLDQVFQISLPGVSLDPAAIRSFVKRWREKRLPKKATSPTAGE